MKTGEYSDKIIWLPLENLKKKGCFYVGGETFVDENGERSLTGHMYTEVYVPKEVRHPYPLVLVHGAVQTALNWVYTADGRPGWLYYFLQQGYIVYIVDQPARGRSGYNSACDGEIENWTADKLRRTMTGNEAGVDPINLPHTQFPQDCFNTFYQTQVNMVHDRKWGHRVATKALIALLDQIGPAVLVTHSQSGPYGWVVADQRPQSVKAVVAIEPSGPAYPENSVDVEQQTICKNMFVSVPLQFDPPVTEDDPIHLQWRDGKEIGQSGGWLQQEPYRQLPNLKGKPFVLITSETSTHVKYDYLTAEALKQCGVDIEYINLRNIGIHGNGHMVMVEKNSDEIVEFINQWLCKNGL